MKLWILIGILVLLGGGTAATIALNSDSETELTSVVKESDSTDQTSGTEKAGDSNNTITTSADVSVSVETPEVITSIEEDLDLLVFDDLDQELEDIDVNFDLGSDIDFGL